MQNQNNQPTSITGDALEDRFLRLEQALQQTQQELINQRQINTTMEQELNRQRQSDSVHPVEHANSQAQGASASSSSSSFFSQVRARAPESFTGLDISMAPIFIHSLQQYINLGGILDEQHRVDLAITFFAYPANEWILAAKANNEFPTLDAFVEQFSKVYNINAQNEVVAALYALGSIQQADTQSVSDHYAKFLSLAYRAKTAGDVSTANQFLHSLRHPLRKAILRDSSLERTSLASVLSTALRHERAFNVSNIRNPPPPRRFPSTFPSTYASAPNPPRETSGAIVIPSVVRNSNAMDVDAIRPRLTLEERQRREINRLCIICASSDHFRRDCPEAYHNKRLQQNAAKVAAISAMSHFSRTRPHFYQNSNVDIRTLPGYDSSGWSDFGDNGNFMETHRYESHSLNTNSHSIDSSSPKIQECQESKIHKSEDNNGKDALDTVSETRSRYSHRSLRPASRSSSSQW